MVARGEIWWYENPDVQRRPWLIITRDEAIHVLNQVLAVPATRTIRGIPTEVELGRSDGMPTRCALVLDNVTTIRRALCTQRITMCGWSGCSRCARRCAAPPPAEARYPPLTSVATLESTPFTNRPDSSVE